MTSFLKFLDDTIEVTVSVNDRPPRTIAGRWVFAAVALATVIAIL